MCITPTSLNKTVIILVVFSICRSSKPIQVSSGVAGFCQLGLLQPLRCQGRDGPSGADGWALSQHSPPGQDDGVGRDEGRVSADACPERLQDSVSGIIPFQWSVITTVLYMIFGRRRENYPKFVSSPPPAIFKEK